MPNIRNLLSFVALVALSALSLTAIAQAWLVPLRTGRDLGRGQVIGWLVSRDLGQESTPARLRLARQLAEDLREGNDWTEAIAPLDAAARGRLRDNVRELARVWLVDRATAYFAVPEPYRADFLDEQLDDIMDWPIFHEGQSVGLLAGLPRDANSAVRELEAWASALSPAESQQVRQFLGALYVRWLRRGFDPFGPAEK